MSVEVIFESMFGNTRTIAEAVAEGLREGLGSRGPEATVSLVDVSQAPADLPEDVMLLVLGGPTHAFSMSRPATREDALGQAHVHDAERASTGLREWIAQARPSADVTVITFDTRVKKAFVPGSAARSAARALAAEGFARAERGETFWVADSPGPLLDGEVERARAWGVQLAARA
ncbi:hypothetical protein GA0111570_1199 [Raineyella antarctica]|uniref:Flavodoxin-like domain-containing protein n=1 Tax=Raineyella antarctica TaxID=1577474 RepID=A0A1G6IMY0_9ACTN|nr:flavodoxin family protein [Raineyella antarctica]SDC07824.1 hypothetical protein GA0111570_1199 [Raineyella antarctica]